jgi:tetratricopeptide (TPR) repeat protein
VTNDVQRLIAALRNAKSLEEFQQSFQEPQWEQHAELYKHLAAAGIFDRVLYEQLIIREPGLQGSPGFEELISATIVEPALGRDGSFKLREPQRAERLRMWDQQELKAFSHKLAEFYEASGDDLSALDHLVVVDPQQAKQRFIKLYKEADKRFDLSRCDSLLRILRERSALSGDLTQVLNEHEQYYRGRTLFADSYFRTATFYAREPVTQAFDEFLRDDDAWIFQLYAGGGFGKTMYLHWLASRYCVVNGPKNLKRAEIRRIPVARIDFDLINLDAASRWPWLLLLPIARQLDQQVLSPRFATLIPTLAEFDLMLRRPGAVDRRTSIIELESRLTVRGAAIGATVLDQFRDALANISGPVIVMLDTVEEAVLHHQSGLKLLLLLFENLRLGGDGLRLILAGRYDLRERGRFPPFAGLSRHARSVRIPPFSPEEARAYLLDKRQLRKDHPLDAIIRKADGNPFKLSLFADLSLSRSSITAQEIENYPRFDLAYLIERVILRIPDEEAEVRWALRYGAIPRQLTYEFMRSVMAPHIRNAMRAAQPRDRANENLPEPYKSKKPFARASKRMKKMDAVWTELQKYASSYGWIVAAERELKFQPDVVVPMRALLEEQDGFRILHHDAAAYFEKRARAESWDSRRWAASMAEVVYHRFQERGTEAALLWKEYLTRDEARSPSVRRALAEVLISKDFLDDSGKPLKYRIAPGKYEPILTPEVLALAYLETASAIAQEAWESDPPAAAPLEDASEYLVRARRLSPRLPAKVGAGRWAMIEATIKMGSGSWKTAVQILRTAIRRDTRSPYRVALEFQLGDALRRIRDPSCIGHYRKAYKLARSRKAPPIPLHVIERRLGHIMARSGRFDTAIDYFQRAFDNLAEARGQEPETATTLLDLFELRRIAGEAPAILPSLLVAERSKAKEGSGVAFAAAYARVGLAVEERDPIEAQRKIRACEKMQFDARSRAMYSELNAHVLAELLDFRGAEREWQRAQAEWRDAGSIVGGSYCLLDQARVALRILGDNTSARGLLEIIERSEVGSDSDLRAACDVLTVELFAATQDVDEAARLWRDLLKRPVVRDIPLRHAWIKAAGMAAGLGDSEEDWSELGEILSRIRPESARLMPAQNFQHAERSAYLRGALRSHLEGLVPMVGSVHSVALNSIEFHRVIGAADKARRILDRCVRFAVQNKSAFLLRKLALAADRLHVSFPSVQALPTWEREFARVPALLGATLLEEAYRGDETRARVLLPRVKSLFTAGAMPPSTWTARYQALAGRLAAQAGDSVQAEACTHEARRISSQLENPALLRALAMPASEIEYRIGAADVPTHVLELDLRGQSPKIRFSTSNGSTVQVAFNPPDPKIWLEGGNYSVQLLKMWVTNPQEFAVVLAQTLGFDAIRERIVQSPPGDCAIVMPRGALSAIPIEAAGSHLEAEQVRHLYRTSFTRATQREPTRSADVDRGNPPCILIVQRSRERERFSKQSYGARGLSVSELYEQAGLATFVVDPEPRAIGSALSELEPDLIHIVAGFRESTDVGENHLFFEDSSVQGRDPPLILSSSLLARMVGHRKRRQPVLILDTPTPIDRFSLGMQLFLRNAFAADLFAQGTAAAILATGLERDVESFGHRLIWGLKLGVSVGQLAQRLRTLTPSGIERFAPTALWTADPEQRLI